MVEDIRQLKDFQGEDHNQRDFILKEGCKVDIKLTRPDKTGLIVGPYNIPAGKEAKVVIMVQIRDLGNWDDRPALTER